MQAQDEARSKPAASMAESADIRALLDSLFDGVVTPSGQETLFSKVSTIPLRLTSCSLALGMPSTRQKDEREQIGPFRHHC